MNDYRSSMPRLVLGIVSIAMTATTLGLFVLVPAMIDSADRMGTEVVRAAPSAAREAVVSLERIEVRGVREASIASATGTPSDLKRGTEPIGTNLQNVYRVSAPASGSLASAEQDLVSESHSPRKQ